MRPLTPSLVRANARLVRKACAPGLNGLRILVDREHATLSTHGLESTCRVPPAPECRIDIVPTRLYRQSRAAQIRGDNALFQNLPDL